MSLSRFSLATLLAVALGSFGAVCPANAHNPGSSEIEALTKQLEQTPDDIDLLLRRAVLFLRYGDLIDTKKDANRILELEPGHRESLFLRANCYFLEEKWADALSDLDQAIAPGESDPSNWALRGKVLLNLGKFEKALADLDRAISAKEYDVWLLDRGQAYVGLEQYDRAASDFQRVIDLTGGIFGTEPLWRLRMDRGDGNGAAAALQTAIEGDGENPSLLVMYGRALQTTDPALAREPFRTCLTVLDRDFPRAGWGPLEHLQAGWCHAGLGDLEKARQHMAFAEAARASSGELAELKAFLERCRKETVPPAPSPAPAETEDPPAHPVGRMVLSVILCGAMCVLTAGGARFAVLGATLISGRAYGAGALFGLIAGVSAGLWTLCAENAARPSVVAATGLLAAVSLVPAGVWAYRKAGLETPQAVFHHPLFFAALAVLSGMLILPDRQEIYGAVAPSWFEGATSALIFGAGTTLALVLVGILGAGLSSALKNAASFNEGRLLRLGAVLLVCGSQWSAGAWLFAGI